MWEPNVHPGRDASTLGAAGFLTRSVLETLPIPCAPLSLAHRKSATRPKPSQLQGLTYATVSAPHKRGSLPATHAYHITCQRQHFGLSSTPAAIRLVPARRPSWLLSCPPPKAPHPTPTGNPTNHDSAQNLKSALPNVLRQPLNLKRCLRHPRRGQHDGNPTPRHQRLSESATPPSPTVQQHSMSPDQTDNLEERGQARHTCPFSLLRRDKARLDAGRTGIRQDRLEEAWVSRKPAPPRTRLANLLPLHHRRRQRQCHPRLSPPLGTSPLCLSCSRPLAPDEPSGSQQDTKSLDQSKPWEF